MEHKELINRLRNITSRSKEDILTEAASAIENLENQLSLLRSLHKTALADLKKCDLDCAFCANSLDEPPCERAEKEDGVFILCDDCPFDCPCVDCRDNNKWEWRGHQGREDKK